MGGRLYGDVVERRNEKEKERKRKERTPMLDASVSFLLMCRDTISAEETGRDG